MAGNGGRGTSSQSPDQEASTDVQTATLVGVGCFTAVAGFFSGGMIAVLIAKIVTQVRGCTPIEGTPACDWHVYAGVGVIVGAITLPLISIMRLKSRRS
jgi:hypothetical protein